jgi:hypothetical protein
MASVPRRPSTTSASMLTQSLIPIQMPGMMNRMSPPMMASPTRTLTSSTDPSRWKPKR